jgi:hypothetical protein
MRLKDHVEKVVRAHLPRAEEIVAIDTMPHLWPNAADGFGFNANVSVIDFLLRHARP